MVQQAILTWVSVADALPPMNKFVLIHRFGGKNEHDDVLLGYRKHKHGTLNEWEWCETGIGQTYWGLSVDGSEVLAWADLPVPPKMFKDPGRRVTWSGIVIKGLEESRGEVNHPPDDKWRKP